MCIFKSREKPPANPISQELYPKTQKSQILSTNPNGNSRQNPISAGYHNVSPVINLTTSYYYTNFKKKFMCSCYTLKQPANRKAILGSVGKYIRKAWHFGLNRYCPVCNSHVRKFYSFGLNNRPDARCPVCDMLERHRAIWLLLKQKTNLTDGQPKKMMHVAPEGAMEKLFRNIEGIMR